MDLKGVNKLYIRTQTHSKNISKALKGKPKGHWSGYIGLVKAVFDLARKDIKMEKRYLSLKSSTLRQRHIIINAMSARALLKTYGAFSERRP